MRITNCNQGDCGMSFKIDKQDICCFYCEHKEKCGCVCSRIAYDTTEDDIFICDSFIID